MPLGLVDAPLAIFPAVLADLFRRIRCIVGGWQYHGFLGQNEVGHIDLAVELDRILLEAFGYFGAAAFPQGDLRCDLVPHVGGPANHAG